MKDSSDRTELHERALREAAEIHKRLEEKRKQEAKPKPKQSV